jgi:putative FmdB family regulatory protein
VPIYIYRCEHCGEFEYRQPISEPAIESCPRCGNAVKRVITGGIGFAVKGRGSPADRCGNDITCCGRETRCDEPPCGK